MSMKTQLHKKLNNILLTEWLKSDAKWVPWSYSDIATLHQAPSMYNFTV